MLQNLRMSLVLGFKSILLARTLKNCENYERNIAPLEALTRDERIISRNHRRASNMPACFDQKRVRGSTDKLI